MSLTAGVIVSHKDVVVSCVEGLDCDNLRYALSPWKCVTLYTVVPMFYFDW